MILVPFHLGWRGLQNRRARFESWKEPPPGAPGELPAAWRTVEHNELLARCLDRDPGGVIDGHSGHRSLEVFAAALSIEWG